MFLLKLLQHCLCNAEVHQVPPDLVVHGGGQHRKHRRHLARHHAGIPALKAHHRHLSFPGPQVVEEVNVAGALVRGDIHCAVHRIRGSLVHQRQDPAAGNFSRRDDGLSLSQRGVGGDGDHQLTHGLAIGRILSHLLGKGENASQDLLPLHFHIPQLEGGSAPLLIIAEFESVEALAEAEFLPPGATRMKLLCSEVLSKQGVEECGHLRRGLADVRHRIVPEDPGGLEVRHCGGGLALGVGVEHNLQRCALFHKRHLKELVPQVDAHDLCLACCQECRS
mmetsp:Transcript_107218/g.255973  ORF Transcript_107218/g.255973 Transcript_107218/m.255973 type:complete len:279 (-) Transcript_107218:96-932(-)